MRPIPFGTTQEAWFLRPNLEDRKYGHFLPAPTGFAKEEHVFCLPGVKPLQATSKKILLTVQNELFYSNKIKTPTYTFALNQDDKVHKLFLRLA